MRFINALMLLDMCLSSKQSQMTVVSKSQDLLVMLWFGFLHCKG